MGFFDSSTESESQQQLWGWRGAMPGITKASRLAEKGLRRKLRFFPDQTYAEQTPSEAEAIAQMQEAAGAYPGMLEGYMGPASEGWMNAVGAPQAALGMNLQDVMNNPALSGAADAIQARVNRNLTENVLPNLTTQFMGYGGLGGTRQGVAEGLAAGRTSDVLAENLSRMYGDAWAQGLGAETSRYLGGLNAQQAALSGLPQMLSTEMSQYLTPAALLQQAGGLERAEEQRAIDEAIARHNFAQYEPFHRSQLGMGLLMDPAVQFGINTTKSETTSKPSTFSNIGKLATTAAAIAGGVMTGGAGFGLMAGMGAMGGMGGMGGGGGAAPQTPMFNNPWTSYA